MNDLSLTKETRTNAALVRNFLSHSIGLDGLFDRLISFDGNPIMGSFPPCNIIKDEGKTFIEMALARYSKDDIKFGVEDNVLSVEGTGYSERKGDTEVLRGIASRRFNRSFSLGEHVEVNSAELKDGLLTVELEEVLPPEKQPKTIEIK